MTQRHSDSKTIIIGVTGNPNTGKSTIFNALTGSRQKSGNYPGVTVEKKEGTREYKGYTFKIYDLPGTYSLTAYSIDEIVTRDFIINEKPDILIDVLDATNLERNLYLCLQFQELGIPIVGAINIVDQAEERGIDIDEVFLGKLLNIPLVKTVGTRQRGVEKILDAIIDKVESKDGKQEYTTSYGQEIEKEIDKVIETIEKDAKFTCTFPSRWLAIKLLEKDSNAVEKLNLHEDKDEVLSQIKKSTEWLEKHFGEDLEIVISEQRYGYIHGAIKESVKKDPIKEKITKSELADSILLHPFLGLPIFLFILWFIFQMTFTLSEYPVQWLEAGFSWLGNALTGIIPNPFIESLIVDGIIGGVGGVLVFLPIVVILFLGISLLEDSGYMSRTVFIVDKFFHMFGLHGQSFIPLFIGFGCTVPAIMAARTIKNPIDRTITILIVSLMSCGARLPVYALFIGAFFPHEMSANILFLIYLTGIALALLMALVFRKFLFKGVSSPFVMELPPYRMPTLSGILWHIGNKSWNYIKKAGTIILAASVVVWFITSFPKPEKDQSKYELTKKELIAEKISQFPENTISDSLYQNILVSVDNEIAGIKQEEEILYSIAGRIGKFIEPVMKPLGFDWKVSIALISATPAKELVVSTFGVIYKVDSNSHGENESLREALIKDPNFNPVVAFSLMLFILIYFPCISTLAMIKSELGSWKWVLFVLFYTSLLAWSVSFAVYQIGNWLFL